MSYQTSIIIRRIYHGRAPPCAAKLWARQMPIVVATTKAILDGSYNGYKCQTTAQVFGRDVRGGADEPYALQGGTSQELTNLVTEANPHQPIDAWGLIHPADARSSDIVEPPTRPPPPFARPRFDTDYFTGIQWVIQDP